MAPPLKALPVILFFFLPLMYSLGLAPLFASTAFPDKYTNRLKVAVADFDGGIIGSNLTAFLAGLHGTTSLPGFEIEAVPSSTSPDALKQKVIDGDVWAAVYVTSGATNNLNNALQNPAQQVRGGSGE